MALRKYRLNVGITSVGSGIGQAVLDSLRDSSLDVYLVGFEASVWAKGAYECDSVYRLPFASDPEYRTAILRLCQEAAIDILIPGSEPELIVLAEIAPKLESRGCRVLVSAPECVRLCRDELNLYEYLSGTDVLFVKTWSLSAARDQADNLNYPVVVKPRDGAGSVGVQVVCNPSDWERINAKDDWIVQDYLVPVAWHEGSEDIRSCLEQIRRTRRPLQRDELSVQVFVSENGKVLGRFASLNSLKEGVPMQVDPVDDEMVWSATEKFTSALIAAGLKGPCNFQGRITPEGVCFFEANPRFTGITHVRALMGYNEVEAAIGHFVLKEDEATIKRCLRTTINKVGLRQMTEVAVPRRQLNGFQREGKLLASPQFERVLITGATGYLGYALTCAMLEEDLVNQVIAPVRNLEQAQRLWKSHSFGDRLKFVEWVMPNPLPALDQVDVVIHGAAMRPGSFAEPESCYQMNVLSTLSVVNSVRLARVPYLIFVSSQSVYGVHQPPPWTEESPLYPETSYSFSKASGEALVKTLDKSSTRWAILRMARLYGLGPNMRWDEFVHRFALLAAKGHSLPVNGNGRQRMDLLHVNDAASFFTKLLHQPPAVWNRIYNLGSGSPLSVNEIAERCVSEADTQGWPKSSIKQTPDTCFHPSFGMNIERARQDVGWLPRISLADGLSELIHFARTRRN